MRGTEQETGTPVDLTTSSRAVPSTTTTATSQSPVPSGRWVQKAPRRAFGLTVLGLSLVGVAVGLELTLTVRTFEALAVLVAFTIVAVITYTAITVSAPTTVTLEGPVLEVRRGRLRDTFDLSGHLRRVWTTGRPNRPNWRIRFEHHDGRVVELGPTQVDPQVMMAALARYRPSSVPPQRRAAG